MSKKFLTKTEAFKKIQGGNTPYPSDTFITTFQAKNLGADPSNLSKYHDDQYPVDDDIVKTSPLGIPEPVFLIDIGNLNNNNSRLYEEKSGVYIYPRSGAMTDAVFTNYLSKRCIHFPNYSINNIYSAPLLKNFPKAYQALVTGDCTIMVLSAWGSDPSITIGGYNRWGQWSVNGTMSAQLSAWFSNTGFDSWHANVEPGTRFEWVGFGANPMEFGMIARSVSRSTGKAYDTRVLGSADTIGTYAKGCRIDIRTITGPGTWDRLTSDIEMWIGASYDGYLNSRKPDNYIYKYIMWDKALNEEQLMAIYNNKGEF